MNPCKQLVYPQWQYPCLGVLCFFVVFGAFSGPASSETTAERDRFVLIVAHNSSLRPQVPSLRYADDDGARFYELLSPGAKAAFLLTTFDEESQELYPHLVDKAQEPSRSNLMKALGAIQSQIDASRSAGRRTLLHIFFTGHGELENDGQDATKAYFNLVDGPWTRDDMIEEIVAPQWADYTHITIDACNAYFLVQGRGDWKDDEETNHDYLEAIQDYLATPKMSERYPRTGWLLSTSGAQEVHEWGRYQAGVFSHQLRSALVGAADVDGDGELRYDEIEAYIGAANAAVSNPSARISMTSQPPGQKANEAFLVRSDLNARTRLKIQQGESGHYIIEDDRGLRYADVSTIGDRELQIALLGGGRPNASFFVREGSREAHVTPPKAAEGVLTLAALEWHQTRTQSRSSIDEAFRAELFAVPFSADFHKGYITRAKLTQESAPTFNVVGGNASDLIWSAEVALGGGSAILDRADPEVGFGLGLRLGDRAGFYGRAMLDLGISSRAEFANDLGEINGAADIYRVSYGVGGGYGVEMLDGVVVGGELGLGHMWLWVDPKAEGSLQGDRTGFRGLGGLFVDVHFAEHFYTSVGGGVSANITSALIRNGNEVLLSEELNWQFGGQLKLGYTF